MTDSTNCATIIAGNIHNIAKREKASEPDQPFIPDRLLHRTWPACYVRYGDFRTPSTTSFATPTPPDGGVFGPWGSGKTNLMQMLHQKLEKEGLAMRRTVWFTAWEYDRQNALWRAFILHVLDALYPRENEPQEWPRVEYPVLQNPGPRETRLITLLNRLE